MPLPGTVKLIDPGAVPADYPISTGTPIFGEFGSPIPSARTPREPLHRSVRHIALIVGTWSRLSSSGSTGEQQSGAPDASSGDGMIIPKPS